MFANDTSFVDRLPGDNASTLSVGGEGSARTAPTMETDVLPEIPDMFMTAVLGTSASKRVLVVSTEPVRKYAVARSQASPDQPKIQSVRTILLEVDVLACPPRRVLFLDDRCKAVGSALVCPRHAKTASRPPSCPAGCCLRFSGCLPHSQWTRNCLGLGLMTLFLLLLPKGPREGGSKNKVSSTSRGFPHRKAHDTSSVRADIQVIAGRLFESP